MTEPAARDEGTAFLLQSLRDLDREREAGDISEEDYAALRDDYTVRAAAALRAEQRGQRPPPAPARPRSWGQRALIALGVVAFAGLSGWLVAQASGRRESGETITGEVTQTATQEARRCIALTNQQELVDAIPCYQGVLEDDPENPVARTYLGWTLVLTARQAAGVLPEDQLADLYVEARDQLDRAVELDPQYADARAFQVVVAVWEQRWEEAARQLALFDDLDAPADVTRLVETQRAEIEAGLAGEAPTSPTSTTTTTP